MPLMYWKNSELNVNRDLGNDKNNIFKTLHKHVLDGNNIFK
jgi:hypothetical protein